MMRKDKRKGWKGKMSGERGMKEKALEKVRWRRDEMLATIKNEGGGKEIFLSK